MSCLWYLYSYSRPAFEAYLGGGRAGAVEEVVAAATWDAGASPPLDEVRRAEGGEDQLGGQLGRLVQLFGDGRSILVECKLVSDSGER